CQPQERTQKHEDGQSGSESTESEDKDRRATLEPRQRFYVHTVDLMGDDACLLVRYRLPRGLSPQDVPEVPRLSAVGIARDLTRCDVRVGIRRQAGLRLILGHVERPSRDDVPISTC